MKKLTLNTIKTNQRRKIITDQTLNDTKRIYEKFTTKDLLRILFLTTSCRYKIVSETGSKLMEKDPTKLIQAITKLTYFTQFCGGETLEECIGTIKLLKERKMGCMLDYSVEGFTSTDPKKEIKMVK
jgi:proline dehydrogenase